VLLGALDDDVAEFPPVALKVEDGDGLAVGAPGANVVLKQFAAASRTEVEALARRVAVLEKRLAALERRRRKPLTRGRVGRRDGVRPRSE